MKALVIILGIISHVSMALADSDQDYLDSFQAKESNYSTSSEYGYYYNGAPWANGTRSSTTYTVNGACRRKGAVDDKLECQDIASQNGYKHYQTVTDRYSEYHGAIWDRTTRRILVCFVCDKDPRANAILKRRR